VWADVPWSGEGTAELGWFPAGHAAAVREDEETLAERFAGVPVWFGRSTLQWWALPGRAGGRLLSAPSAPELASLLDRVLRPQPGRGRMAASESGAVRADGRVGAPAVPVPSRVRRAGPRTLRLGIQPQPC